MSRGPAEAASFIVGSFTVKIRVRTRVLVLRLTPDPSDGGFVVTSPSLRGLNTQGETVEEAIANGKEAALALLTEPARRHP